MKTVTPQLPTILGSFAAMLVAFLSLMNGTSPGTCMAKAGSAFLVFAGFGLILRFALTEGQSEDSELESQQKADSYGGSLDMIVPGTSVADLLGVRADAAHDSMSEDEQAAA